MLTMKFSTLLTVLSLVSTVDAYDLNKLANAGRRTEEKDPKNLRALKGAWSSSSTHYSPPTGTATYYNYSKGGKGGSKASKGSISKASKGSKGYYPPPPPPPKSTVLPPGKGKGAVPPPPKVTVPPPPKVTVPPPPYDGGLKGGGWNPPPQPKQTLPPKAPPKISPPPHTGKGVHLPGSCQQVNVFFEIQELRSGYQQTDAGGGFDNIPFYSQESGEQLGFYSDAAFTLDSEDCVGTGAFNFGDSPDYPSQINFSFTCFGLYNTVTGGSGQFGCAKGYETFVYQTEDIIASSITVCGPLCPAPV
jgi:hypothetical protein